MTFITKGCSRKFNINTKVLMDIIKDNISFNDFEGKLKHLETKLITELYENEEYKKDFGKTIINIVEIVENEEEKLKGFIIGDRCYCTSITITLLEDEVDILFNEDFNNTSLASRRCFSGIDTTIIVNKAEDDQKSPKSLTVKKSSSNNSLKEGLSPNKKGKPIIINDLISHEHLLTKYPPSGSTLDDYEIIESLGQGAFGFVRRAKKKGTNDEVIIKFIVRSNILRSSWMRDDNTLIPSEIHILLYLTKIYPIEGIPKILDYWQDEFYYYFVMESDRNIDLFEYIENYDIDISQARDIFKQIVKIIYHLHSHGIVHMDIKDENIIINTETKKVKLIDFGSSSYYKDGMIFKYYVSSGDYSAPETFTNKYEGPPQDIWSLGVLLYTILFKHVPFEMKATSLLPNSRSTSKITESYPSPAGKSNLKKSYTMNYSEIFFPDNFENEQPELYELIKLMLNKDYKKRPNIKSILEHIWLNPELKE